MLTSYQQLIPTVDNLAVVANTLAMAAPPNLTMLLANAMKMEKEIFWIANRHLPADEQQRRWTAHTAELTSALGPAAPTKPLDLHGDGIDLKMEQQDANVNHTLMTKNPSVMATTLLLSLWRLILV